MSTQLSTVDFLVEQMSHEAPVTFRKMFGEYALYCQGKVIALVCDDQLFLKPTTAGKALVPEIIEQAPYPGAKPYLLIVADLWDDNELLSRLAVITEQELPPPKKSPHRRPAGEAGKL